ncbi:tyrosine-type recombinase/integrase [Cellulomonas sp. NPDC055163]
MLRDIERYGTTKGKAETALKAAVRDRVAPVKGATVTPETSVADVARLWLAEYVEAGRLAETSKTTYRNALHRHVIGNDKHKPGALAALAVREVNIPAVERALAAVAQSSGAGAAKTVRSIYRGIFRTAVRHGAIVANPVAETEVPYVERVPGERDHRRALTRAERDALLAYVAADDYAQGADVADLIAFMLGTGVRVGEATALRWDRVDLANGTARIEATLVRKAGGVAKGGGMKVQERTKTAAGVRVVHLPGWVVALLIERLARESSAAGVVFASPRGKVRDQSNTSSAIRRVLDGAGLEWATSHTFRRTAATMLDQSGLSARAVATVLGHSQPSMTQDVYMASDFADGRAAAVL